MENAYGIGITNRFGCFLRRADSDSDGEADEVLKAADAAPKPKVKSAEKENRTEKVDTSQKTEKTAAAAAARKGIRDANQKGHEAAKGGTGVGGGNRPPVASNDGQKQNRGPRPERNPQDKERAMNKYAEAEREERNNRRNREEMNRGEGEFGERRGGRPGGFRGERRGALREGGSGRPPGYERGATGGRGGPRKREFDRHSQTDRSGVKSVDKREGAGSRNWGTYKDEIEPDVSLNNTTGEEPADEKVDKEQTEEKVVWGDGTNEDTVANGPAEPKLMTLEEWKATQQPRQKPVFNLRKAGEGEDQSQWQNLTLKKKEKVVEQEEEEYEDDEEYDCPQRAGRQKQILEIDFHFADSRRGGPGGERRGGRGRSSGGLERDGRGGGRDGGDRGDRGGDRGDRGGDRGGERGGRGGGGGDRGGERGGRGGFRRSEGGGERGFRGGRGGRDDRPTRQAAPRVDDVNDFPSLG